MLPRYSPETHFPGTSVVESPPVMESNNYNIEEMDNPSQYVPLASTQNDIDHVYIQPSDVNEESVMTQNNMCNNSENISKSELENNATKDENSTQEGPVMSSMPSNFQELENASVIEENNSGPIASSTTDSDTVLQERSRSFLDRMRRY
jgi:L-lactate utilization protein LutC